jgi:hypothetical protein
MQVDNPLRKDTAPQFFDRLPRIDWRSPWTAFWIALVVRVLYISIARSYRFKLIEDHFQFGWEMGRIARALVQGRGYADPFVTGTGPTSWSPPLYPLLLAGVFKLFGVYTALSSWVILSINSVFSALIVPAIYEIAIRCYGDKNRGLQVAQWSMWLWALHPAAMQYAVRWVWEMSLTTMLFSWVLVFTLRIRDMNSSSDIQSGRSLLNWLLFGTFWGLIALSNPALLLFFPVCLCWLLMVSGNKGQTIKYSLFACLVFIICLTPWIARNWLAFHALILTRGNLGAELYAGNGPGSDGFPWGGTIPLAARAPNALLYKNLGEVSYVKLRGDMAKAYIRAHPMHFTQLSLKRFYFYWAGVPHPFEKSRSLEYIREINYCLLSITGLMGLLLSLKRNILASGLFLWAFVLIPLSYYFVTPGARFRHPLEPLIVVFSVFLFLSAFPSGTVPATISSSFPPQQVDLS